jgi:hypothetical protein
MFCPVENTRSRVFICGKLSSSGAAAVMVRAGAVTARGAVWRAERHELTPHLYAAIGVDVDDYAQRAVEAMASTGIRSSSSSGARAS